MTVFTVHVAGEPGPDMVQRCVPCGAVLIDNRGALVPDGADRSPGWWEVGGLVGTNKSADGQPPPGQTGSTYPLNGRELAGDERTCATAATS